MEARLLDYYNRELAYLREMGAEFARAHPKVAGRLGMQGLDVADPYVERLLEGVSFLTARVQLKMDAEFPRFTQRLLEVVYPNYLAPTPAMTVVQLAPSMNEGSLARGFTLPRGTALRAGLPRGEQTPCEFVTGHAVRMWPLSVTDASFGRVPEDLPAHAQRLPGGRRASSALRIRLTLGGGTRLEDLDLDQLVFHLNGPDTAMHRLLELLAGHSAAVVCQDGSRPARWHRRLPGSVVRQEGFGDDQALLPVDARVFQGYRLMQEYFAFPARYLFFSINGLRGVTTRATTPGDTRAFELVVLFDAAAPELDGAIHAAHLALHCTPAINLFTRRTDRVAVTARTHEYHLVVDRTRPMDYEVFGVTAVTGHGTHQADQAFRPFYGTLASDAGDHGAYYAVRREPRLLPEHPARGGTRSGYTGSEVYLSLVDRAQAPFDAALRHLSVDALCTNRDLSLLMPLGSESDFTLRVSAPVSSVQVLRGPSRPRAALGEHAQAWHLISHLGLNYQSLLDLDADQGAAALREMLRLYANVADPAVARQIDGLRHARLTPVHHRLPTPGPMVYGRGVRIDLDVDEAAFSGLSPYLFGAVLDQFFARHVSINTMTELVLSTLQNGERARWAPRMGARPGI